MHDDVWIALPPARQMLEDVNTGIDWVLRRIRHYGGDPGSVFLVGQSAGGQLAALALIQQAQRAATGGAPGLGCTPAWEPRDVRGFVGVSGAYNLDSLADHLHKRGLYRHLFETIMSVDGRPALHALSPTHAMRSAAPGTGRHMPDRVWLVHGTRDKSVPHSCSQELHDALTAGGVRSACILLEGKTHTSFLLEDPMCEGRDVLMETVLAMIAGGPLTTTSASAAGAEEEGEGKGNESSGGGGGYAGAEAAHTVYPAMCPRPLATLAGWICPF